MTLGDFKTQEQDDKTSTRPESMIQVKMEVRPAVRLCETSNEEARNPNNRLRCTRIDWTLLNKDVTRSKTQEHKAQFGCLTQ